MGKRATNFFVRIPQRPLRGLATLVLPLVLLAGLGRFMGEARGGREGPWHGAQWIWADGQEVGQPAAFYAVAELTLDTRPEQAWIKVVADESYILYVAGQPVGAGGYRDGEGMDEYSIAPFLVAGYNRLVLEVRSETGAGGLLASISLGERNQVHRVTDSSWLIFRQAVEGLPRGSAPLDTAAKAVAQPPKVWGPPTVGHWRLGEEPVPRDGLIEVGQPEPHTALRARHPTGQPRWRKAAVSKERLRHMGRVLNFDFGRQVEGFLQLSFPREEPGPGLLVYGDEEPDLHAARADEILMPVPGSGFWQSSAARSFRYVLIVGPVLSEAPKVLRVGSEAGELAQPLGRPQGGPWGLQPPPSSDMGSIEEEVRRRLMQPY